MKKVTIGQQLVAPITQIPRGHNLTIITICQSMEEATYYLPKDLKQS